MSKKSKTKFEEIVKNESNVISNKLNDTIGKNYTINIVNDNNENILNVFNSNNKRVLTAKYEILGNYNNTTSLFNWGCDMFVQNKNLTALSKEIKNYSKKLKKLILEENYPDSDYLERLYYYLTNDIFYLLQDNVSDIVKLSNFILSYFTPYKYGIITSTDTSLQKHHISTYYILTDIISY